MSFLEQIVASTRSRLAHLPTGEPPPRRPGRLMQALAGRERLAVIAEVKRRSPSRGELDSDVDATLQAQRYTSGGAAAISVLTEPTRFGGNLEDLSAVAATRAAPVLMKDFLIDPEQVRVGALLDAAAVLLIVRLLDDSALAEMLAACEHHGVDALVECHERDEVERALGGGAKIIGVNNRNLDTLDIDTRRALELLPLVPAGVVAVAESGYLSPADTAELAGACDAVLIGSALMTSDDPAAFLREVCS